MNKLKCAVQNYEWGQIGSDSLVAKIFSANGGLVDENKQPGNWDFFAKVLVS